MLTFSFDLLIIICLSLVSWGFCRTGRFYQFPFLIGCIFLIYLLPQGLYLVNEYKLHAGIVSRIALQRLFIYSSMCLSMCWIGYQIDINYKLQKLLNIRVDYDKLFLSGILLLVIGFISSYSLLKIDIQLAANGNWTGSATILIFFAGLLYISLPIFLLAAIKKPTIKNISLSVISSLPMLERIFFYGRRQNSFAFIITLGLCFFIVKRFILPKWFIMLVIFCSIFLIPVMGQLRGEFWSLILRADISEILEASSQAYEKTFIKGQYLELRNAALIVDASVQLNKHGFGTGLWDGIIRQFVPGQIVGFDLKNSLQFNLSTYNNLSSLYGYKPHNGLTSTGLGDSFFEFSYFGCFIFALIATLFKNLWVSAIYFESIISTLLYIGIIDSALLCITHGITRFVQELLFNLGVIILLVIFTREKN